MLNKRLQTLQRLELSIYALFYLFFILLCLTLIQPSQEAAIPWLLAMDACKILMAILAILSLVEWVKVRKIAGSSLTSFFSDENSSPDIFTPARKKSRDLIKNRGSVVSPELARELNQLNYQDYEETLARERREFAVNRATNVIAVPIAAIMLVVLSAPILHLAL